MQGQHGRGIAGQGFAGARKRRRRLNAETVVEPGAGSQPGKEKETVYGIGRGGRPRGGGQGKCHGGKGRGRGSWDRRA